MREKNCSVVFSPSPNCCIQKTLGCEGRILRQDKLVSKCFFEEEKLDQEIYFYFYSFSFYFLILHWFEGYLSLESVTQMIPLYATMQCLFKVNELWVNYCYQASV